MEREDERDDKEIKRQSGEWTKEGEETKKKEGEQDAGEDAARRIGMIIVSPAETRL